MASTAEGFTEGRDWPEREGRRMKRDWLGLITEIPKLELQVHLEGSVTSAQAHKLALKYSLDPALFTDSYALGPRAAWRAVSELLREPIDFQEAAVAYGRRAWELGIVYAELSVSMESHARRHSLSMDAIWEALENARAQVKRRWDLEIRYIVEVARDSSAGAASCQATVAWMTSLQERGGLVGLCLGGFEQTRPLELFVPWVQEARAAGFPVVVYAGEKMDNVGAALDLLKATRVGHGMTSHDDVDLMARLRQEGTPIEVCPSSSLALGHVSDYSPLADMIRFGLKVNVSSGHPGLLGTNLSRELAALAEEIDMSAAEMMTLLENSVDAAFLPQEMRDNLRGRLRECPLATQTA